MADHPISLSIQGVSKNFGDFVALRSVNLEVREGEFFTIIGPSGCGKTTLLRIIAGLERPDEGRVMLGGQDVTLLPASKRKVNTVFQSYALFPHLSIYENIAFGLRARKVPAAEIKRQVSEKLEMLDLGGMSDRRPDQLSGGQRQRVALARALVNEPDILLLDEPLSALDARLRAQLQMDLRRLQQTLGDTFILVTHDQSEALVVSDRIAVMRDGCIKQHGPPEDVYDNPKTRYVAEFLGAANLIPYRVVEGGVETSIGFLKLDKTPAKPEGTLAIRPEWIRVSPEQPAVNGIKAQVREAVYRGQDRDLWFDPGPLRVRITSYRNFSIGQEAWLELAPEELVILDD